MNRKGLIGMARRGGRFRGNRCGHEDTFLLAGTGRCRGTIASPLRDGLADPPTRRTLTTTQHTDAASIKTVV